jgi:hypothetical protein
MMENDDDVCPLCLELPWHAVRTPCGHSFCQSCFERVLESNVASDAPSSVPCPVCREPVAEGGAARDEGLDSMLRANHPVAWRQREEQYRVEQLVRERGRQRQRPTAVAGRDESEEEVEEEEGAAPGSPMRRGVRMTDGLLERVVREQGQYRGAIHLNGKLSLSMSRLLSVSAAALNKFAALTTLQLEHNLLRVLAPLELPLLRSLQLHHNRLARLEAAWLRGVPRLQLLDVSYNRLASLEGVEVLPHLAELRAASNCLHGAIALAPLARGCTGLHTVQLKHNGRPVTANRPRTTHSAYDHAHIACNHVHPASVHTPSQRACTQPVTVHLQISSRATSHRSHRCRYCASCRSSAIPRSAAAAAHGAPRSRRHSSSAARGKRLAAARRERPPAARALSRARAASC